MKHKIFTLLFALLASTTLFAMGRNDGSTKADAIECGLDYIYLHRGGTLWYRFDLAPLYESGDTLRFSISNMSFVNSVEVTCKLMISDQAEDSTLTIEPESSQEVWNLNTDILIKPYLTELYFTVTSTEVVELLWHRTWREGDSCDDARHGFSQNQEVGTKWYEIYAPISEERDNIVSLAFSISNWDGDSINNISVSFKTDCESPAFHSQSFILGPYPYYEEEYFEFPAEFLDSLGWPEIVFSCTSSAYTNLDYYYNIKHIPTGDEYFDPIRLAWDTIEHSADTKKWYVMRYDSSEVPHTSDVRLHFTNMSAELNNIAANIYFPDREPIVLYSQNYQIAPYEDTYIDIARDYLEQYLGWSDLVMEYTSDKDSKIWMELIPTLHRDTLWGDTIVAFVCKGEWYFTREYASYIVNEPMEVREIHSGVNGLSMIDSLITYKLYPFEEPEELSIDEIINTPTLVQGKPLDVEYSNAWLTKYYRDMSDEFNFFAPIDTVYWAKPGGAFDEAPLDLTTPYSTNQLTDTLLLVIKTECDDIFYRLYIFPIEQVTPTAQDANLDVIYIDPSNNEIQRDSVTLHLPVAPTITGFTFLKWQVVAGDLEDGIIIQAVYTADEPASVPEVYTNPANHAQKLIRNGNVYILTDDKVYSITGQKVK